MITSWEEAKLLKQGQVLVLTNGVFDILHAGHVSLLEQARSLGDRLVVAINSDDSVRRLGKGPIRPINNAEDRAKVLAAIRWVDAVVVFPEDTPIAVIEALRPDVHVKGGDYDPEHLPETPLVRSYGGRVVVVPFLEGRSTTEVLRRLNDA